MKRLTLIAIALCLIMLTTVGAGVVTAQQESLRHAGASHIYFYDVQATDTHGTGKLQINTEKHTFVFTGKDFEPSALIALKARAAGSSDYAVFAVGKATPAGNLNLKGTWDKAAAPDDVVGATVFSGTLQRANSYYPDYTLVYTDSSGQKFTIYLPPNTITGGTLPSLIASPVTLDYVYNLNTVLNTVQFVYQGVTYSAHFAATSHTPYLSSEAKYNVFAFYFGDQIVGHVYLNYWDAAQNKYVRTGAAGAAVDISVHEESGAVEHWWSGTTNSEGKFCHTGDSNIPVGSSNYYVIDFSLSPYPSGSIVPAESVVVLTC